MKSVAILAQAILSNMASPSVSIRKQRSCQMDFDTDRLLEAWRPLAVKDHMSEWRFSGQDYEKGRYGGVDRDHLELVEEALIPLCALCPNGFPLHARLASAIEILDKEFQVLSDIDRPVCMQEAEDKKYARKRAADAADMWKIMVKHCRKLKLSPTPHPDNDKLTRVLNELTECSSVAVAEPRILLRRLLRRRRSCRIFSVMVCCLTLRFRWIPSQVRLRQAVIVMPTNVASLKRSVDVRLARQWSSQVMKLL